MMPVFLKYYSPLHPIKNIGLFFRHLKWARQRVRRGYSDFDVSEMELWFNLVVPDMLRDFAAKTEGIPLPFIRKYYDGHKDEIGLSYEDYIAGEAPPAGDEFKARTDEDCAREWSGVIEEMRRLFLEANEDTCSRQNPYSPRSQLDKFTKTEIELHNYRSECRKKAFDMLCEWFECLWW